MTSCLRWRFQTLDSNLDSNKRINKAALLDHQKKKNACPINYMPTQEESVQRRSLAKITLSEGSDEADFDQ